MENSACSGPGASGEQGRPLRSRQANWVHKWLRPCLVELDQGPSAGDDSRALGVEKGPSPGPPSALWEGDGGGQ